MRFVYAGLTYAQLVPNNTADSMQLFENAKPAEIEKVSGDVSLSLELFKHWCSDYFRESGCYLARMFDVDVCIYDTNGELCSTKADLWCFANAPALVFAIDIEEGEYTQDAIVGVARIQNEQ